MVGNLPLCITILLDRLFNLLVPLIHIPKNPPDKELVKAGSIEEALSLGNFRDGFMAFDVINEPLNKVLCTKDTLCLNLLPERSPLYSTSHKTPCILSLLSSSTCQTVVIPSLW